MKNKFYKEIPGWLSDNEAALLYNLCLNTTGSILEIGSLYGKSTSVICEAIMDSSKNIKFDSCDINFKTREEFINFYTKIHGNITVPDLIEEFSFSKNKDIFSVTTEYFIKFNILKYVNFISDNFQNLNLKYNLIFCDAMHDINEININLHHMERLSEDNSIWAIHDFNCIDKIFPKTINNKNINFLDLMDTLAIFKLN